MTRFAVRIVRVPSGERLPVLLDRSNGLPVFHPNLYALTELRQTNRASATIERTLREIAVLLDFLADAGINLSDRLRDGYLLSLWEIDGLARHCRESVESARETERACRGRVLCLGKKRAASNPKLVSHTTAANRLRTIHAYLSWLVALRLSHTEQRDTARQQLEQAKESVLPIIMARIPVAKGRNALGRRQGLPSEMLERLLQVVIPDSPENPWKSAFVRQRNALIMCWLSQFGLRRGELLNVKISDIDFRKNEVMIARRPDDPEDPRMYQPKVKTRDRRLNLRDALAKLTHEYIIQNRTKIPGARRHQYLFVTEHTGAPLGLSALSKMFQTLRLKVPYLPDDLSCHVLRHTWNDEFSRKLEGIGVSDAREEQMRSYLMGWAPTSSTARTYTRRHVEEAARQASLDLQEKLKR